MEVFTELGSSPTSKCRCSPYREPRRIAVVTTGETLPRMPANRRRPARTNGHQPPVETCSRSLSVVRPNRPEAPRRIAAEPAGWTLSTLACRRCPRSRGVAVPEPAETHPRPPTSLPQRPSGVGCWGDQHVCPGGFSMPRHPASAAYLLSFPSGVRRVARACSGEALVSPWKPGSYRPESLAGGRVGE